MHHIPSSHACLSSAGAAAIAIGAPFGAIVNAAGTTCSTVTSGCSGAGSIAASSAHGTSAQSRYAACAPNQRRIGRRSASTRQIATLATSVPRQIRTSRSCVMVEFLDESLQFGQILLAQFALLGKVRDERSDASIEQTVEQALALAVHVVGTLDERTIQIALAVTLRGDDALLEQAVEQRLDRRLPPVGARGEGGHDFVGALRRLAPEHIHHHAFGIADRHCSTIYACN